MSLLAFGLARVTKSTNISRSAQKMPSQHQLGSQQATKNTTGGLPTLSSNKLNVAVKHAGHSLGACRATL